MIRRFLLPLTVLCASAAQPDVFIVQDTPEPILVLSRFLEAHGHKTAVEDQSHFRAHMKTVKPRAIFMYLHHTMDDDIEASLISYAENGGRLIVLHHGIASGRMKNKRWMEFLGVRIESREAPVYSWDVIRCDFELIQLNSRSPITTRGVHYPGTTSYTPSDEPSAEGKFPVLTLPQTELFWNQVFTDGRRKTVLFGMKGVTGGKTYMQDRAGWMMPVGKGHVLYFMPGHSPRDFENPGYAQILLNAVECELPAN
ncbi:MAG: ThuA domain-containing protein [Bryobacteraceae bacterium]